MRFQKAQSIRCRWRWCCPMSRVMGNPNEIRVVNIRMVREPSLYSETPVSTPQDVIGVLILLILPVSDNMFL